MKNSNSELKDADFLADCLTQDASPKPTGRVRTNQSYHTFTTSCKNDSKIAQSLLSKSSKVNDHDLGEHGSQVFEDRNIVSLRRNKTSKSQGDSASLEAKLATSNGPSPNQDYLVSTGASKLSPQLLHTMTEAKDPPKTPFPQAGERHRSPSDPKPHQAATPTTEAPPAPPSRPSKYCMTTEQSCVSWQRSNHPTTEKSSSPTTQQSAKTLEQASKPFRTQRQQRELRLQSTHDFGELNGHNAFLTVRVSPNLRTAAALEYPGRFFVDLFLLRTRPSTAHCCPRCSCSRDVGGFGSVDSCRYGFGFGRVESCGFGREVRGRGSGQQGNGDGDEDRDLLHDSHEPLCAAGGRGGEVQPTENGGVLGGGGREVTGWIGADLERQSEAGGLGLEGEGSCGGLSAGLSGRDSSFGFGDDGGSGVGPMDGENGEGFEGVSSIEMETGQITTQTLAEYCDEVERDFQFEVLAEKPPDGKLKQRWIHSKLACFEPGEAKVGFLYFLENSGMLLTTFDNGIYIFRVASQNIFEDPTRVNQTITAPGVGKVTSNCGIRLIFAIQPQNALTVRPYSDMFDTKLNRIVVSLVYQRDQSYPNIISIFHKITKKLIANLKLNDLKDGSVNLTPFKLSGSSTHKILYVLQVVL